MDQGRDQSKYMYQLKSKDEEEQSTNTTPEKNPTLSLVNYYLEEAFKPNNVVQKSKIRVFVEVKPLQQQYAIMLDKAKHDMDIKRFVQEICDRLHVQISNQMLLYLPPNHMLLDLEPIEKDDLLVLGHRQEIDNFNRKFDLSNISSRPKIYNTNGTGRDTYIANNNGGFTSYYEPTKFPDICRILRSSTEDSNLSILRLSDTTPMAQVGIAILRIFQSLSFRVGSGGMTNDSPFLNSTQKFITSLRKNEYKEGDKKGRTGINKSIDGFSSYRQSFDNRKSRDQTTEDYLNDLKLNSPSRMKLKQNLQELTKNIQKQSFITLNESQQILSARLSQHKLRGTESINESPLRELRPEIKFIIARNNRPKDTAQ